MNIKFSFDETNVQVGFENQFVIKDMTEDTLVKILMLKGEKGDTVSAQWGTIIGNLTDQTDLKNALNSKASASDLNTTNSNVATNTSNIATNTGNIATNTAAIEENSEDIADLQTKVGTNTGDIADLTTQVETNTSNIATNTSNIATNTGNIATNTSNIASNKADIGTLNNLTTTDKTSLVNAVNEINVPSKWVSVGSTAPTNGERVWFKKSKNLFDIDSAYHGTINASGGVGTNEGFRTTQYIKTQPNTNYYFSTTQISGTTGSQIYIAYYDSNYTFLSRQSYNALEHLFTTPANCVYMRAGVHTELQENVMLELGTTKSTYEPYIDQGIYVDNEQWYSKPKVLWTNPSLTSEFASQTVNLSDDLANYAFYEIIFINNTSQTTTFFNSGKIPSNGITRLTNPSNVIGYRQCAPSSDTTKFVFQNYIRYTTYGGSATTTSNITAVPYQILGYKE